MEIKDKTYTTNLKGNSHNEPWRQWALCPTKTSNTICNVGSNTTQAFCKKDHAIVYWHVLQYHQHQTVAPHLPAKAHRTTCAVETTWKEREHKLCCRFDLRYYRIHTDKTIVQFTIICSELKKQSHTFGRSCSEHAGW